MLSTLTRSCASATLPNEQHLCAGLIAGLKKGTLQTLGDDNHFQRNVQQCLLMRRSPMCLSRPTPASLHTLASATNSCWTLIKRCACYAQVPSNAGKSLTTAVQTSRPLMGVFHGADGALQPQIPY